MPDLQECLKAAAITLTMSSIGIVVLCVPTWRALQRARWILLAFLIWRILEIVIQASRNISLHDHCLPGSLKLLAIHVLAAFLIASSLLPTPSGLQVASSSSIRALLDDEFPGEDLMN